MYIEYIYTDLKMKLQCNSRDIKSSVYELLN